MKKILLSVFMCLAGIFTDQVGIFAQRTIIKYLSGTDKDHTVMWDFFCSKGRNSGVWSKIPVPSCWEMQGYGTYHYGWEENFKDNEVGLYKMNFRSDPAWKNHKVRIVFEGSMTDTEVRINGKPAGPIHQGSFYRFKYDITHLLKENNLLEVKVSKISADTSVNRAERMADFWVFGGIFRPVYLEVVPREFIDWTAIDARADGSFLINVHPSALKKATQVEGQIYDIQGNAVGKSFAGNIDRNKSGMIVLQTKIDRPLQWNPEHPVLYQVEVRLKEGEKVLHRITEKFGFRTIEFREGDGFYLNGTRVIFKGVNRHSFWPTSGRTTSKDLSVMDVNLMKDMNMNAVRMSHYPPDAHFLDVCDSLGLMVLDELGGWQKKYDTPVGKKLLKEMIMKDVNHPSIVIWDNGNEGGNNHELAGEYHQYDPQKRKVIHPWNIFQGTDTQHYKGYDCCAGSLYHGSHVFFPTEVLHGLYDGGNGAGLDDHWQLMNDHPLGAGYFLWAFADEGVVRQDRGDSIDVKGDRAPDGIVGPFREKEGSFYTIKEIWSPVQIKDKSLFQNFDGTFRVINNYHFTNLNEVRFSWKIVKLPFAFEEKREQILFSGTLKGPDIAPGESGKLILDSMSFKGGDAFYLTATDKFDREIFTWSWPLKKPKEITDVHLIAATPHVHSVAEDQHTLNIASGHVSFSFSKSTGMLASVTNNGTEISLSNGPAVVNGVAAFKSLKHFADDGRYIVEVNYDGDMKYVRYSILETGILKVEYAYSHYKWDGKNEFDFLGISFTYPEEKITGVKLLGVGPYRVWRNRMKGGQFGVWDKAYNNTVTGESWTYPEFKGYYRNMYWVVVENTEKPFAVFTDTPDLFLRLYTPAKPSGARNSFTVPEFPAGDISFLHGINAIGTKFDAASNHGPAGGKNKIGWEWLSGTLYFSFYAKE